MKTKSSQKTASELEKLQQIDSGGFTAKTSIVVKIFVVYLILTVLDLAVIFIYLGSNQVKQIGKNAVLTTENLAQEVILQIRPEKRNIRRAIKKHNAMNYIKMLLKKVQDEKGLMVQIKGLFTESGKPLESNPGSSLERDDFKLDILKAGQLKSYRNRQYYADLDVFDFSARIFIPVFKKNKKQVILYLMVPLPSIKKQYQSMLVVSLAILIFTLVIQGIFGFYLYRFLIRRLKNLEYGTRAMASGNLALRFPVKNQGDELDRLSASFNTMAQALDERTERLKLSLSELEKSYSSLEDDLVLGEEIQRSILPEKFENSIVTGVITYQPLTNVSGDFYDLYEFEDKSTGILLFDASGHGVPAALVTMMAKIGFAEGLHHTKEPAPLIEHVNNELYENLQKTGNFITALYILLSADGKLSITNAAHTKALFLRADNSEMQFLEANSFCIGFFHGPDATYSSYEISTGRKDRLVLYTDGITEAIDHNETPYESRFFKTVEKNRKLPLDQFHASIVEDFEAFIDSSRLSDDYTLLCIEVK